MLAEAPIRREGDHLIQTMSAIFKFQVTNLSRTSGFVNRVELVPATPDVGAIEHTGSVCRLPCNLGDSAKEEL